MEQRPFFSLFPRLRRKCSNDVTAFANADNRSVREGIAWNGVSLPPFSVSSVSVQMMCQLSQMQMVVITITCFGDGNGPTHNGPNGSTSNGPNGPPVLDDSHGSMGFDPRLIKFLRLRVQPVQSWNFKGSRQKANKYVQYNFTFTLWKLRHFWLLYALRAVMFDRYSTLVLTWLNSFEKIRYNNYRLYLIANNPLVRDSMGHICAVGHFGWHGVISDERCFEI